MDRIKDYNKKKISISVLSFILDCFFLLIIYFSGISDFIINTAENISESLMGSRFIYLILLIVILKLFSLPLDIYSEYFLEHKYNLSNQTLLGWIFKSFKKLILSLVFMTIIGVIFYIFIDEFRAMWWIWMWGFWNILNICLVYLFPYIIIPLFYKCEKIEDMKIIDMVTSLCNSVRFPFKSVERINLGKETVKANAALVGLGNSKRVLLADTLIDKFTLEEIQTVVAHELGHEKKHHIPKLVLINIIVSFVLLFFSSKIILKILTFVGAGYINDIVHFPIILLYFTVVFFIFMPLNNMYSRKLEYEADKFAIKLTKDTESFIKAMEKLADINMADKTPNPLIEFIFYSHPSISKRIKAARKEK